MIRQLITTFGLLLVSASAFGQATTADATQAVATGEPAPKPPPFVASLLLIKADWSHVAAAKEIEADLRKALSGEPVTKDDLAELPASGPRILFPTSALSIYSQQHYAQLLAWLKAKQFVGQIEPFNQVAYGGYRQPVVPGGTDGAIHLAMLNKSYEFFGLPTPWGAQNDLFFTRTTEFKWTIGEMTFQRELNQYEKARGQQEAQPVDSNSFDKCVFNFNSLEDGHVMIVHAFPDTRGDSEFRMAASDSKGFLALIVVEKSPTPAAAAAEPRLLLPDKVERVKAQRMRGSSGGRLTQSGPQHTPSPSAATSPARSIISKDVMISWSEAKDVAWGFSKSLGKWAEQTMDPPAANTAPAVSENLAVWRVGNAYYAFSGQTGRWDVLRLPEGHTPDPQLQNDFVLVHDVDDDYTFAATTGRWSSPKGSAASTRDDAAAESKPDETNIKVFTLRHAKATDAQVLINQLFARDIHSVAADERSNTLIVRGPAEQLNIIFAILTRLDALEPPGLANTSSAAEWPTPVTTATVAERAKQFETKEAQTATLARQIREQQSSGKGDRAKIDKLTADLRKIVGEVFSARQELHRAEAAQLQQRLAGIQQSLQTRQKLSDQIIDHRVKDLLNPDLQWESTSRLPGGILATGDRAASTPSPAQSKSTRGAWWGPETEQIIQELGLIAQMLTGDDAPGAMNGALKVTSIDSDSPAKELQVGDLILGIQTTGGSGKERGRRRRVELHVRRGNDHFPVIVELSPRRAVTSIPGLPGEASPPTDLSAALAYRDKQQQRWEQIERLYHGGRMEFDVMMQAAKDLADAELSAAATPEDRRAARQRSLELLKGVKSIVDAKFDHNIEPEHKKLAVDAEVLKAEAQLAAESGDRQASLQPMTQPAAPTSIFLPKSGAAALRSADDFRRKLQDLESGLADVQSATTTRFGATEAEHNRTRKSQLESYQRDLAFLREEYSAQLRLLELEVQDASSALESASVQRSAAQKRYANWENPREGVLPHDRAVQEATLRLQRAKTLLNLYRKADPKNSPSPPTAQSDPTAAPTSPAIPLTPDP